MQRSQTRCIDIPKAKMGLEKDLDKSGQFNEPEYPYQQMRRKRLYGDVQARMPEGWPYNEAKKKMMKISKR